MDGKLLCNHEEISDHLDTSFNFTDQISSVFIGYENSRIVSVLTMFIPTSKEAEVYGFTLPGFRRRSNSKKLLSQALQELLKHDITNILLVVESQSLTGKAVASWLDSCYVSTEYLMTYTGAGPGFSNSIKFRSTLTSPGEESIEELAKMRQDIFNDNYEEAKAILSKIINRNNRHQYCIEHEGTRIGLGSAYFDELKASIYGLGIVPEYQCYSKRFYKGKVERGDG